MEVKGNIELTDDLAERLVKRYGLPLHVVFASRVRRNAESFREVAEAEYPHTLVCFAVKSNPCLGAVRLAASLKLGIDAVSEFELRAALDAGVPAEKIVCNGNAKSEDYLAEAVAAGTMIAVDSDFELEALAKAASRQRRTARILLRFAGMPLDGLTAADQSTAATWTKFGFPIEQGYELRRRVAIMKRLKVLGISAHIGTQICNATGYDRLMEHLMAMAAYYVNAGISVKTVSIGGGFPVSYVSQEEWSEFQLRLWRQLNGYSPPNDWVVWDSLPLGFARALEGKRKWNLPPTPPKWHGKAYWSRYPGAAMLRRILRHKARGGMTVAERLRRIGEPLLIIEPGRALIGTGGVTLARVSGVKQVKGNNVVVAELGIVNHGTNLVTPDIFPYEVLPRRSDDSPVEAFVGGQLCFTGDMLSKIKVRLNRLPERGDTLVIHHTGAYSADHFASNSCGFPRPAKVAVMRDGKVTIWRKRERTGLGR